MEENVKDLLGKTLIKIDKSLENKIKIKGCKAILHDYNNHIKYCKNQIKHFENENLVS